MGPISQQRLSLVNPLLAEKIKQLEQVLGQELGVTQGVRTHEEQDALFAQGRTPLEVVNEKRVAVGWAPLTREQNGKVTKAAPGQSYHEFGLACDCVPVDLQGKPDWNLNHPVWQEMVAKGRALGLTSGISWDDHPHFQIQGTWDVDKPPASAQTIAEEGGLEAVWDAAGIGETV